MTEELENESAESMGEHDIPIEAGCSSLGAVCDEFLVIDLGRDIEVSALKFGPKLLYRRVENAEEGMERGPIRVKRVIVETARIRTSPQVASFLALDLLTALAKRGGVNIEALEENLKDIKALAIKAEEEEGLVDDEE